MEVRSSEGVPQACRNGGMELWKRAAGLQILRYGSMERWCQAAGVQTWTNREVWSSGVFEARFSGVGTWRDRGLEVVLQA